MNERYLSWNFSGALPVMLSIAELAAFAAESISDSGPDMYSRPNAPNGVNENADGSYSPCFTASKRPSGEGCCGPR